METYISKDPMHWLIFGGTLILAATIYFLAAFIMKKRRDGQSDKKILHQGILALIILLILIGVTMTLPIDKDLKVSLVGLLGIVLSAIFALSSATLIGNVLAGILLRIVNNFKPGDYIEIDNVYGRVSERSLFHTELQTIDSDLITLPNLYLATHPVKVKRTSGTFIAADVSLGYEVSRRKIEKCLLEAAERAGLLDAFIYITSLGDYSVVYEVHGRVSDVKKFISSKSLLRAMMLDVLHENDIEIVSPSFMNQRQVNEAVFIPKKERKTEEDTQASAKPEELIFEKAEKAESIEKRKDKIQEIDDKLKELHTQLKEAEGPEAKASVQEKIDKAKEIKDKIETNIEIVQEKMEKES